MGYDEASLGEDILRGAGEIAQFLYGATGKRRRVYDLAERGKLPIFRDGTILCARKSRLRNWVCEQEDSALLASKL